MGGGGGGGGGAGVCVCGGGGVLHRLIQGFADILTAERKKGLKCYTINIVCLLIDNS